MGWFSKKNDDENAPAQAINAAAQAAALTALAAGVAPGAAATAGLLGAAAALSSTQPGQRGGKKSQVKRENDYYDDTNQGWDGDPNTYGE